MNGSQKTSVLIIDDEKSICIGVSELLETYGYRPATAGCVDEGIAFLKRNPDTDIILLDVNLGASISGSMAIPLIREVNRYVQIVMFTSQSSLDLAVDCMKKGAFDFMTKPFDENAFFRIVPGALEKKKLLRLNELYLGILAHDLKNPVNNISLSLQLLQDSNIGDLNGKQHELLGTALSNVWEISNMISNIVNVTKFETGGMAARSGEIRLEDTAREALAVFSQSASLSGKNLELRFLTPQGYAFHGDKELFEQVLLNIASNSLRFCPRKQTVEIEFTSQHESSLEVSIKNPGSFIPPDEQEDIFSKFFGRRLDGNSRAKRNFGLGLTYSKMAVELMGGRIGVRSTQDPPETVFHFTIRTERGRKNAK